MASAVFYHDPGLDGKRHPKVFLCLCLTKAEEERLENKEIGGIKGILERLFSIAVFLGRFEIDSENVGLVLSGYNAHLEQITAYLKGHGFPLEEFTADLPELEYLLAQYGQITSEKIFIFLDRKESKKGRKGKRFYLAFRTSKKDLMDSFCRIISRVFTNRKVSLRKYQTDDTVIARTFFHKGVSQVQKLMKEEGFDIESEELDLLSYNHYLALDAFLGGEIEE